MKKILSIILCAVMLLPMLAYTPGLSIETKAAETAVYVRDGGNRDGSSADKPPAHFTMPIRHSEIRAVR